MAGFHLICVYLACYLTITQVSRFFGNEDTSTIKFKQFNESPDDVYPAFTICFHGAEIRWYNEAPIFDSFEVTSLKYGELLMGEEVLKYEYDYNTRLYEKIPVDIRNGSNQGYEGFSLHISNVFTGLEYGTDDDINNIRYGKGRRGKEKQEIPLDVSYSTPDMICFTRKSTEAHDKTMRTYDWLLLNESLFSSEVYKNSNFEVFMHHPGQLIRSFHKPVFKTVLDTKQDEGVKHAWDKVLNIKIEEVTVLRKRYDSNTPCDSKLDHLDDTNLIENIIRLVGCFPTYWKKFAMDKLLNMSQCHSPSEYGKIYNYIQNYKDVMLTYDPPCTEMKVLTKVDREEENKWDGPCMKILYIDSHYLNIANVQSFGFESFVSGVGGFIGIFLGYSLLQIPVLLECVISFFQNMRIMSSSTNAKNPKKLKIRKPRANRKKHRSTIGAIQRLRNYVNKE